MLGEMGRNKIYKDPAYSGPPGRDHWGTTQFVIVAGGGFKQGMVLGKTDKTSLRVTDNYYSPISHWPSRKWSSGGVWPIGTLPA
jgi:hypothetical protein